MQKCLLVLVLVVVPAMAQMKDLSEIDTRLGPPDFGPVGGTNCSSPSLPIPDEDPTGVIDTMNIVDQGAMINNLTVIVQATHTWCGDLQFTLTHVDTATSADIIDRPGWSNGFGCSGDDYDVALNDGNPNSVQQECAATVPAIAGDLSPYPDALAAFAGEAYGGDWTMTVADHYGGDTGTLDTWCVDDIVNGDGGDGGTGTPATSTWGVIGLIALFMTVAVFYLRRRSGAGA
jgi:hypothetical protein